MYARSELWRDFEDHQHVIEFNLSGHYCARFQFRAAVVEFIYGYYRRLRRSRDFR